MKFLIALLLSVLSLQAAFPPVSTWDREAWVWAKVKVPTQTNTVSDAEYGMARQFMIYLKQRGAPGNHRLRSDINRAGIYLGSGVSSCAATFIADTGSTNDDVIAFGSGDYTTSGLAGDGSTKRLGTTSWTFGAFTTINNIHLSVYSQDATSLAGIPIGCFSLGPGSIAHLIVRQSDATYAQISDGTVFSFATDTNGSGFYVTTRTSSNYCATFRNAVVVTSHTNSNPATTTPTTFLQIHARGGSVVDSYTTRRLSYYSVGLGMSPEQIASYTDIVQWLQRRRGRAL